MVHPTAVKKRMGKISMNQFGEISGINLSKKHKVLQGIYDVLSKVSKVTEGKERWICHRLDETKDGDN